MKRKISLLLLLVLPFAASADFVAFQKFYTYVGTSIVGGSEIFTNLDDAYRYSVARLPIRMTSSGLQLSIDTQTCITNSSSTAVTLFSGNQYYKQYQRLCSVVNNALSLGYFTQDDIRDCWPNTVSGSVTYFRVCVSEDFFRALFDRLTVSQLMIVISSLPAIQSDVSALVPLVESNKYINAGIALDFKAATTNAQYQRSEIINDLTTIINNRLLNNTVDYDIPQIRDAVGGFRLLDPEQPTGDNTALMTYYYALRGLDFMNDQPGLAAQMVQDGFATSTADAASKLISNTFRASTLGPAVSQMRAKRDAIAKLKAAGMSAPPGGGSFDDMNLGELETLYQYSYNTPVSSNATVQAHALDQLKEINSEVTDAAGILSDIRNEVTGPLEVEVLNWPDDFTGLSVTLSNAFAEALANLDLNVSSEVWQLGRDYEEYRTYSAGINPSYDSFFSDASFLAAPGPNDGKWWTESQNLLAYIAYYTASNRSLSAGILAELTTNAEWIAASLAAASNNLAVIWGNDPRGWLDSKLEQLQSGQTELLDNFNSLTYFQGVGDIIDTYYTDVQQVPDTIAFNTPFPVSPSIDLRRIRGFLDLLHAATTLFLIGGWLICVPYIARWMFEHVNRVFDLIKK